LYYLEERARLPTTFLIGIQLGCLRKRFGGPTFDDVVARLGLEPHLQKRFDQLSGGEGRRAALAAALIRQPNCLLADEPFYGIAPKDQRLIGSALRELAAAGTAVIATGHEVEALLSISDEVVWCVAGTTHSLGGPDEARAHREFVREYLGWHLHSAN
jgi:ABC-type Mn2+/Zn2+ transport system ATPase subunit